MSAQGGNKTHAARRTDLSFSIVLRARHTPEPYLDVVLEVAHVVAVLLVHAVRPLVKHALLVGLDLLLAHAALVWCGAVRAHVRRQLIELHSLELHSLPLARLVTRSTGRTPPVVPWRPLGQIYNLAVREYVVKSNLECLLQQAKTHPIICADPKRDAVS
jgi:hypothetical protein